MKANLRKRKFAGVVESAKMDNTVKVSVEYKAKHPRYHKILNRKKYYLAHTDFEVKVGDKVTILESRPYSKKVAWLIVK